MADPYYRFGDSEIIPAAGADERLLQSLRVVCDVWSVRKVGAQPRRRGAIFGSAPDTIEFRGRLTVPSDEAFDIIAPRFQAQGYVAAFRQPEDPAAASAGEVVVLAVPGELPRSRPRRKVAAILFVATFISVFATGALGNPTADGAPSLLAGAAFALSLIAILGAHEMGHYLMSRRLNVPASLPFFIPMPLSLFGTMGAVMQMQAPPRDRRRLLAVAVAGPLAGLVVAIPVLIVGLLLSPIQASPEAGYMQEGNSLLYIGLKFLTLGRILPAGGEDVFLHPLALAGWAGLLVTGLNLIPAGQLDGGHVAYVLLGRHARKLTWAIIAALLAMGAFVWDGWLLWAGLVFIFGQTSAMPFDDVTPLRAWQRALAFGMFAVFVLVFTPVPVVFR